MPAFLCNAESCSPDIKYGQTGSLFWLDSLNQHAIGHKSTSDFFNREITVTFAQNLRGLMLVRRHHNRSGFRF